MKKLISEEDSVEKKKRLREISEELKEVEKTNFFIE